MARCVYEALITIRIPFSNPFSRRAATDDIKLHWICGCWESINRGMECTNPELKVRCCHYKPESVVNQLPDRTEGEHEPPPM